MLLATILWGIFFLPLHKKYISSDKLGPTANYLDSITEEITLITSILIASKTALLARMDILDKTAAKILMSLEKFSPKTVRSRIELILYRPKCMEYFSALENPQSLVFANPESLLHELIPTLIYYLLTVSQDFHFLKSALEQAGKTVYKKKQQIDF